MRINGFDQREMTIKRTNTRSVAKADDTTLVVGLHLKHTNPIVQLLGYCVASSELYKGDGEIEHTALILVNCH